VFDLEKLVEFMSIGTLLAYTIVSASVIILRYRPPETEGTAMLGVGAATTDDSSQSGTELPSPQSDVTIVPLLWLCHEFNIYISTVIELVFQYKLWNDRIWGDQDKGGKNKNAFSEFFRPKTSNVFIIIIKCVA
jgi:hypothetical protein